MASAKRSKAKRQKDLKTSFPYIQLIVSLTLLILGASIMIYGAFQKAAFVYTPKAQPVAQETNSQPVAKPAKLYIPDMARILNVSDGYAQGNRWTVSETGVSYLTTSALPQENGNTVMYGHNRKGILGGLWRVGEGDYLYVILENGQFVKYQVFERKEIKPTQVEILAQTDDTRLTLYTCSGFLDSARYVVVARQTEKII